MVRSFGQQIKSIRTDRGLTQIQMAELLGYKVYTTITKFEADLQTPQAKTKKRIAETLNWDFEKDMPIYVPNEQSPMPMIKKIIQDTKTELAQRLSLPVQDIEVKIKF